MLHHGLRLERTGATTFAVKQGRFRDRFELTFSLIEHSLECTVSLPHRIRLLVLVTTLWMGALGAGLVYYAPMSPWLFAFPWMAAVVIMILGMLYDINRSTAVRLAAGLGEALRMPQQQAEAVRIAAVQVESYTTSSRTLRADEANSLEAHDETLEAARKTRKI